ncbi:hypothetical protein [Butyrivibrio sp. XPD2002]|uniref:hypothetical protein n=1 Tax=Butyrivibrio sp. XPD2002 TaxID=1280665 RepID=UPI0003FBB859|nr:hypothetical protein [Butyrivibrio sp. XPD2002]
MLLFDDFGKLLKKMHMYRDKMRGYSGPRYAPIQRVLRKNYTAKTVDKNLLWFYNIDIEHLGDFTIPQRIRRKIVQKISGC